MKSHGMLWEVKKCWKNCVIILKCTASNFAESAIWKHQLASLPGGLAKDNVLTKLADT